MKWVFAPMMALALCAVLIVGNAAKSIPSLAEPLARTEFLLNTVVTITLYEGGDDAALEEAFALCADMESRLSRTLPGSDVYRINHAQGRPVMVGEDCASLLREGIGFGELTGGALDITVEPLSSLWDFTADKPRVPTGAAIDAARVLVDYREIHLTDDNILTLPPGMGIDLGAVAKGYIADRIALLLRELGVTSALINLGGDVRAVGGKPNGEQWRVGIKRPFAKEGQLAGVATVSDMSVVTSGTYERGFESNGVWYHHLMDTRSGYPAQCGLHSVTVISASALTGDALSTACFVMGAREGLALIERQPGVEAVFITEDFQTLLSSGIESGETLYQSLLDGED